MIDLVCHQVIQYSRHQELDLNFARVTDSSLFRTESVSEAVQDNSKNLQN